MPRMELADVIFVFTPESPKRTAVDVDSGPPFLGHDDEMTLVDVFHNFAARLDPAADPEPARRRCVVQADFVYQCMSEGRWIQSDYMDGWEIMFVHCHLIDV